MLPQSLNEWLELLETRHPTEIELGLDRVGRVAERLGLLPFDSFNASSDESGNGKKTTLQIAKKIITIAGTNGKGSCVSAIDSILREAGYQVGTYTSPHFLRYNERICINGLSADDESICAAFERIEIARADVSLTYFEFGTLAAFLVMADHELDVAVLEVGLGGRLDAVNIVDADIGVVTSIALDHEDWLGSDLNVIAGEKAAIGRAGKPLIYGDINPVAGLLEKAKLIDVELMVNGCDFSLPGFYQKKIDGCGTGFSCESLLPSNSVACAVQAVNLLAPELPESVLEKGLSNVVLKGRYQQEDVAGIRVVLDVAHNPQAAGLLADRLTASLSKTLVSPIRAVFGAMEDKDIDGMWEPLLPLIHSWYFCDIPEQDRAAKAKKLAVLMYNKPAYSDGRATDQRIFAESSPVTALEKALADSTKGDTLVVFGSFFTVGPVLSWLESVD